MVAPPSDVTLPLAIADVEVIAVIVIADKTGTVIVSSFFASVNEH